MEFKYEDIAKLSEHDVRILNGLLPLAEEAKEAEQTIISKFLFHIGEEKIILKGTAYNYDSPYEYITCEGVWVFREADEREPSLKIRCDAASIFEYFKSEYCISNKLVDVIDNRGYSTADAVKSNACKHLRAFINRVKSESTTP